MNYVTPANPPDDEVSDTHSTERVKWWSRMRRGKPGIGDSTPGETPESKASTAAVFRAFTVGDFVESKTWLHIQHILTTNGGCFGISGARGAGKTWLMLRSIKEVENSGGLGLWHPSPSEYESTAFLSSLTDSLANRIQREYSDRAKRLQALRRQLRAGAALIALALVIFAAWSYTQARYYIEDLTREYQQDLASVEADLKFYTSAGREPPDYLIDRRNSLKARLARPHRAAQNWTSDTGGAVLIAFAGLAVLYLFGESSITARKSRPDLSLFYYATEARERLRYSVSLKQASESGIDGGAKGFTARLKQTKERALAERPITLSSLVYEFRELATLAASALSPGSLIVTLDELDKLENEQAARALLRDIKGIFDVEGVHFLVSVSNEAAGALHLGPIHGRNEFNSSFYSVMRLPPLSSANAIELIKSRKVALDTTVTIALNILSGGNPRELVRLTDLVQDSLLDRPHHDLLPMSMMLVMREERDALLEEVLSPGKANTTHKAASTSELSDEERLLAWRSIPEAHFQDSTLFVDLRVKTINDYWTPDWASDVWRQRFQEPWRRLLVRLFIAATLAKDPAVAVESTGDMLTSLLIANSQSAGVGLLMLKDRFASEFI